LNIFSFFHIHIVVYFYSTERESPPEKFFSPPCLIRLIQVASLASRHEQITVRAAFFCSF
jgi:hypothetical protein